MSKNSQKNAPEKAEKDDYMKKNAVAAEVNGREPEFAETPNGLPLFFKNPKMLNADQHKTAGIKQNIGMNFARGTNSILITTGEFVEASKFYPIVFTAGDNPTAAAMVGLEHKNYFIDDAGVWREDAYIPAYARQYPFVFAEIPQSNQLTLCIDEGAEHYTAKAASGDTNTARLFDEDGKPSKFTNMALEFCSAVQKEHVLSQNFTKILKELDLLSPQEMEAKLNSGRIVRMNGFQTIDQQKLQALADDKVLELHKSGVLALIYFAVLSTSNWTHLLRLAEKSDLATIKAD